MKKVMLLICCLACFFAAYSQTGKGGGTLSGIIYDTDERPLAGITLVLEGTQMRTATAANGVYEFRNIPAGTYTLVASGIGYTLQKNNVQVQNSRKFVLNLKLVWPCIRLHPRTSTPDCHY